MTEDNRRHAFPEALLIERGADGARLIRGVRYRWNTGEAQVSWCDRVPPDPATLEEEPVCKPNATRG